MLNLPDRHGHFGEFGGSYVAETLMPALAELEKAYQEARRDPEFKRDLDSFARIRRTSDAAVFCGESHRATWWRKDLPQARGPLSYRRAQGEQHARPGAARGADGQVAHHGGDRRRSAWRGDGDDGGAVPARVRSLHGLLDVERQSLNVFRMKLLGAKVTRSMPAARASRTRSTRRCATGSRPCATPTT